MANGGDADNPGYFTGMPNNLRRLVKAVGFATFEDLPVEEEEIYNLVREGKCMTCRKELGRDSNFIVTCWGIVGGYCSGVCHSDMAVVGFLQEQHDHITQQVQFRGGGTAPDTVGEDPAFEDDEGEDASDPDES